MPCGRTERERYRGRRRCRPRKPASPRRRGECGYRPRRRPGSRRPAISPCARGPGRRRLLHRIFDHTAGAVTRGAGALDGEEALLRADAGRAVAGRALTGREPAAAPLPPHGSHGGQRGHAHGGLLALEPIPRARFRGCSADRLPRFSAARRLAAALAAAEIAGTSRRRYRRSRRQNRNRRSRHGPPAILEGSVARAVIGGALLVVLLGDLVGFADRS